MAPEGGWCGFKKKRGGLCAEPITRGILNPDKWLHNVRMFNLSNSRGADAHEPVPMTDDAAIAAARRKWREPF